jgi:hypothetical protein
MTARGIAHALGGRRAQRLADGGYLIPCPVASHGKGRGDRSPSLRISDGDTQLLVRCFAGCDARDVLDELRRRGLLDHAHAPRISDFDRRAVNAQAEMRRPRTADDLARIRHVRDIWHEARDSRGTLAERYLREHRRLDVPDDLAGRVLRFHPACPWRNENTGKIERIPALIVPFRSLDDDEITGIHRIALEPFSAKPQRRMLGVVHRAAVKLDDWVMDELAIGEGLETCMAARLLGIRPTWALGSVGGIAHFPVLPGIPVLRIISENDQGSSAAAIELCGPRWQAAGRRVRIIKPALNFKDLNDALGAHG